MMNKPYETILKGEVRDQRAFTLVEVLVGSAIFLIVAVAFYSSFTSLMQLVNGAKSRTLAVELADEQFEIIRNMPYKNVGLTSGIPLGVLPQNQTLSRGGFTFNVHLTIRNINLSTSTVQASDRLVEVAVTCPSCKYFQPVTLTGQISPANLQSASNGGALIVKVFDGAGKPVPEAIVDLQSVATSSVVNNDVTNNNGALNIIGVPQGVHMYRISVFKPGYSIERTYPLGGAGNPNPINPDVTVLNQQLSEISLAIDKLSSLSFTSVTPLCAPVGNFDFSMSGAREIGVAVPKYSQNLVTNGSGVLLLPSMEWDTYSIVPTDTAYELAGINPYSPFALNPDNAQSVQLVVVPKNSNSLMVSVQDGVTKLPVSGAIVELTKAGYDQLKTTGEGYISQTDWSGGKGQDILSDPTKYWDDNGRVDASTSTGNVLLSAFSGQYNTVAGGILESSTFDTGTSSNFYTFSWSPLSQPALAGISSLKFQFAANSSSTDPTWNYAGPDGTSATYYLTSGSPIDASNNGKRYARYVAYLSTDTATVTPQLSNVSFSYTSGCVPPGQVIFQGLETDSYVVSVMKAGYSLATSSVNVISGWQEKKINISP